MGVSFADTGKYVKLESHLSERSTCLKATCVFKTCSGNKVSAELKGPRTLIRIRPPIFDFEPDVGLKLGQTTPKMSGKVPTNRHATIPKDSRPISACLDDDPKLLNCLLAT